VLGGGDGCFTNTNVGHTRMILNVVFQSECFSTDASNNNARKQHVLDPLSLSKFKSNTCQNTRFVKSKQTIKGQQKNKTAQESQTKSLKKNIVGH
jgi:hypothetical protein